MKDRPLTKELMSTMLEGLSKQELFTLNETLGIETKVTPDQAKRIGRAINAKIEGMLRAFNKVGISVSLVSVIGVDNLVNVKDIPETMDGKGNDTGFAMMHAGTGNAYNMQKLINKLEIEPFHDIVRKMSGEILMAGMTRTMLGKLDKLMLSELLSDGEIDEIINNIKEGKHGRVNNSQPATT